MSDKKEPNSAEYSVSRRCFIKGVGVGAGALAFGALGPAFSSAAARPAGLSVSDLPVGAAPSPVPLAHFPDRLHAFVWRNWQLVPAKRMARVVGATTTDIVRLGRAMGLNDQPSITRDQQSRSQLTVIRRNWQLLPYDQLLDLLGWTPDQLEYALREDDFLFIKLGNLKPKCERLRYAPPDQSTIERERDIARIVRETFQSGITESSDPLFGFVSELSRKPDTAAAPAAAMRPATGQVLRGRDGKESTEVWNRAADGGNGLDQEPLNFGNTGAHARMVALAHSFQPRTALKEPLRHGTRFIEVKKDAHALTLCPCDQLAQVFEAGLIPLAAFRLPRKRRQLVQYALEPDSIDARLGKTRQQTIRVWVRIGIQQRITV